MRTETCTIYDYWDMMALNNMSGEEAAEILRHAYRAYINIYEFPNPNEEFSEEQYENYKLRCAFKVAEEALEVFERRDEE